MTGSRESIQKLLAFAASIRDLDEEGAYTMYLQCQRLAGQYREMKRRREAEMWDALGGILESRYDEARAA